MRRDAATLAAELKREQPVLWAQIESYCRYRVLTELWRASDRNMLAARDDELAARKWEWANQWIGGYLAVQDLGASLADTT